MFSYLLSILSYLGLSPFLWHSRKKINNEYLEHHIKYSLIIFFLFILILFIYILMWFIFSFLIIYKGDFYYSNHIGLIGGLFISILIVFFFILVIISLSFAIFKRKKRIFILSFLSKNIFVLKFSANAVLLLYLLIIIISGFAIHSKSIVKTDNSKANVCILYDDMGIIPNWIFTLGYYKISKTAIKKWGDGSIIIKPISIKSLNYAFQNCNLLIIASHGIDGAIITGDFKYNFFDVPIMDNKRLMYVYFAGCEIGKQYKYWAKVLYPARIDSYDRNSAVLEHVFWAWTVGPEIIKKMPK